MARIASLQPSVTLTLAALDRLDALCAVTKYCIEAIPALAVRNLPILHDSWSFDRQSDPAKPGNLETLLAARPDLVIASVPYRMESLAAILKSGLPVLALAPHSLADVYADIRLIAAHVAADPEPLIARMQQAIHCTRAHRASCTPEANARWSTARSGAGRSFIPSIGSASWSRPRAGVSSVLPAHRRHLKSSPQPTPTCCSSPGAERATASRWTA